MSLCLVVALAAMAAGARAEDEPAAHLSRGKQAYRQLDYEGCLAELRRVQKERLPGPRRADLELHLGLCHYNLGRRKAAEDHFAAALAAHPEVKLPRFSSPKLVELFDRLAARRPAAEPKEAAPPPPAKGEPAAEPPPQATAREGALVAPPGEPPGALAPTKVPAPAVQDAPVERPLVPLAAEPPPTSAGPKPLARLRPFALPLGLAAGALAAAGTGGYFGLVAKAHEREANEARFESDAVRLGQQAQSDATVANVAFGVAAAAAAGALVSYLLTQP